MNYNRRKEDNPSQDQIDKKLWVARLETCDIAMEAVDLLQDKRERKRLKDKINKVKDFRVPCN